MTILLDWENQKKKYSKFIFELHVFEVWEKYTELKKNPENYYYLCNSTTYSPITS